MASCHSKSLSFPALLVLVAAGAALFSLSCASAPRAGDLGLPAIPEETNPFASLDAGAQLYLRLDAGNLGPIAARLGDDLSGKGNAKKDRDRLQSILDMSSSAIASVHLKQGPEFSLVPESYLLLAKGKYPACRAALSFTFDPRWKKKKTSTGSAYWRSSSGLSLAFFKGGAALSNTEPFSTSKAPPPPPLFPIKSKNEVGALWIPDSAPLMNLVLGPLSELIRVPIQSLVLVLERLETEAPEMSYVLSVDLLSSSTRDARLLATLVRLLQGASISGDSNELLSSLLSNKVELQDSSLHLHSKPISADKIALLWQEIAIYSKQ